MEKDPVETQTMHIVASGMSITTLSGSVPTSDSTDSDSERKGFTVSGTSSHIRCLLDEMTEEHANQLIADFSELWKERTVESLDYGIYRISVGKRNSSGG